LERAPQAQILHGGDELEETDDPRWWHNACRMSTKIIVNKANNQKLTTYHGMMRTMSNQVEYDGNTTTNFFEPTQQVLGGGIFQRFGLAPDKLNRKRAKNHKYKSSKLTWVIETASNGL